jgi:hypothetical protein
MRYGDRARLGDRLTLTCSCEVEVIVPTIIMLPRHHVVRILARGKSCLGLHHARGRRAVVRWSPEGAHRAFTDIDGI